MGLGTECLGELRDCLSLGLQFPTQTVDWDGTPSEFLKLHTSIRDCVGLGT